MPSTCAPFPRHPPAPTRKRTASLRPFFFFCALREARLKVSSTFSKVAGSRDGVPGRAPQSAELSCALLSAGGGLRGNPRRGFPLLFILALCACAPIRWEVVDGLCCDSTPFLWCLPKETVSSRQRKALLTPPHHLGGPARLSHLGVSPNGTNWCVKLVCTSWVDRALKSA